MNWPELGNRIAIVGTSGSGKSTLCQAISRRYGIPAIGIDDLNFGPNWTERPGLEDRIREAVQAPAWVVAGNYGARAQITRDLADTVIWIDLPYGLTFWRMLRRCLLDMRTGRTRCNGNRQQLWPLFRPRTGLIWWVLFTYHRRRRQLLARTAEHGYLHLKGTQAVRDFAARYGLELETD